MTETANSLFAMLAQSTPDGILVVDEAGRICFVNPAAARMFDRDRRQLIGLEFGHPVIPGESTEIELHAAKGDSRVAELRAVDIDRDGHPAKLVAVRDITDRKQLESDLRQQMDRLKHAIDDLDHFAWTISHDLRAPLLTMKAYLHRFEAAAADGLSAQQLEQLDRVKQAAASMDALIEGILTVARSHVNAENRTPVDLGQVLEVVRSGLTADISKTGAAIQYDRLPTVLGDYSALYVLFQNLIENALKYRSDKPPRISVVAQRTEGHWQITVQDNGVGIDEENRERVFEMFRQLGRSGGTEAKRGLGIGLTTCKRIVESLGGKIHCESEPGCGTAFIFTLPAFLFENDVPRETE